MKKQYIYAAISIFLWSTTTVTTKLLLTNMTSAQMLCIKSLFAFLFLFFLNCANGKIKLLRKFTPTDLVRCTLVGLMGPFLSSLCLYKGTEFLMGQEVTVINYLWPIMSVLAGCLILREKMTVRKGAALLISFIGGVFVVTKGNIADFHPTSVPGILITVLAATLYGLHVALAKKYVYDGFILIMLASLLSFLLSGAWLVATKTVYIPTLPEFLGLIWLGVFLSAVAYSCWTNAFEWGDSAKISNLAYISPFLSLVFIRIFLKEEISLFSVLGLAIIIAGILLQQLPLEKQVQKDT